MRRARPFLIAEVGLHHLGIARHLGRRAVGDLAAWCSTSTRSTWRSSVVTAMLDPDHRQVRSSRRRRIQLRHALDLAFGQAGSHLVEQRQLGARGQRHADLQQALLAGRDRRGRQRGLPNRQTDQVEDAGFVLPAARSRCVGGRRIANRNRCWPPRSARRIRAASGRCGRCPAARSGAALRR